MKSSKLIIILLVALCAAMYFLGKKNGSTEIKSTIINNTQLVRQIAELASLEVTGTTTLKRSNAGEETGIWANIKNYFAENTLQISIPYIAKYGVDVAQSGNVSVNHKDSTVIITLPESKLLSLQLQLDQLETMNQTGLLVHTTVSDMKQAEQQLYSAANAQLSTNKALLEKAKAHISEIFSQYYASLGYRVVCNFTQQIKN
ncbi:MAG: DUF4230 domain-containing protein [Ferruginibacter sp.]